MQGKIIKGIAGFYYVHTGKELYECKAKGIFRNKKIKPLVGDNVKIEVLDEEEKKGNITEIIERKNQLIRPAVANIDQILVIFAAAKPAPNFNLLDRFLVTMEGYGVDTIICFNKKDLVTEEEMQKLQSIYAKCGYQVIFTSTKTEDGIDQVQELIENKTTALAGPSGVGKSSMINLLHPHAQMETGNISEKIERGKHTTRHSEIFHVSEDTFIMDTPGFSSLYVDNLEKEELRERFPEFLAYEGTCRFQGCVHIHEPECRVKEALEQGNISRSRYENYKLFYEELKEKKKYGKR